MTDDTRPPEHAEVDYRPSTIPWENSAGMRTGEAFWRTVGRIFAVNGRLGAELSAYIEPDFAKRFRKNVMGHAVFGIIILISFTMVNQIQLRDAASQALDDDISAISHPATFGFDPTGNWMIGAAVVVGAIVLNWLLIRLAIGAAKWFFVSRRLSEEQQWNAIALVQYLSAPWALMPLAAAAPSLFVLKGGRAAEIGLGVTAILMACLWIYWLQMMLFAMRSITGLGWGRVAVRGLGLLAVWAVLVVGALLVPLSVPMWLLMRASLQ